MSSREADRPLIVLSVDHTLWHRLGGSRLTYARSVESAGGRVHRLSYGRAWVEGEASALVGPILRQADGLLLSGGGDVDPARYRDSTPGLKVAERRDLFELALLEEAQRREMPILGICRGAQLINIARGGSLRNFRSDGMLADRHRSYFGHPVELDPQSRLARVLAADSLRRVASLHGLAVDRPGNGLTISARAPDGIVEAIETGPATDLPFELGVQWHPELSPLAAHQRNLFRALVAAARAYRAARGA